MTPPQTPAGELPWAGPGKRPLQAPGEAASGAGSCNGDDRAPAPQLAGWGDAADFHLAVRSSLKDIFFPPFKQTVCRDKFHCTVRISNPGKRPGWEQKTEAETDRAAQGSRC